MLTENDNKHFSERLYYADNLPAFAGACYNGNIAAAQISQKDTAFTFDYTYDALNRLTESEMEVDGQTKPSEWFNYDARGNITQLQRYSNNRLIDDLQFNYQENGNQLLSIRDDGEDADLYSTIEYHNSNIQSDTTMFYDANGNLIRDLDRGITAIRYNILNLPDTIQFSNGGQIVNFYDAVGRKYKSITYINIASVIPQQYDFAHYSFETDSIEYLVTEYTENIEKRHSKRDTTVRIHNTIGYYSDSTYYHYIKDHLGNVCAVVNSERDSVVQRTMYYASGVPMAQSRGRDVQPYLYNGKEFVEAHGLNTYDYGFRGYYAPLGRFTSIDPLAEQTPWQSPYSYAGNRFVNAIDWMGLGAYTTTDADEIARLLGHLASGRSLNDFSINNKWIDITDETDMLAQLYGGFPEDYTFSFCTAGGGGGGYTYNFELSIITNSKVVQQKYFRDTYDKISEIAEDAVSIGSTATNAWASAQWNPFYWIGANGHIYTHGQIHTRGGYANSFKRAGVKLKNAPIGKLGKGLGYLSIGLDAIDIIDNGVRLGTTVSLSVTAVGMVGGPFGLIFSTGYGLVDLGVGLFTGSSITDRLNNY